MDMFSGKALVGIGLVTALGLGALQWSMSAQDAGGQTGRIETLEATQQQILKELQEIKALLQGGPGPQPTVQLPTPTPVEEIALAVADAPSLGRADAPVVLVEFSDFECPFCARFTRETREQLIRDYVDTGKVRYVFKHYPIERIHPRATRAAEAAECSRRQNRFWDLHETLFANQQALGDDQLRAYARDAGVAMPAFEQCFAGQATARVKQDLSEGARAGITGTPTFFIGTIEDRATGRLDVKRRVVGAQPYAQFREALDSVLTEG